MLFDIIESKPIILFVRPCDDNANKSIRRRGETREVQCGDFAFVLSQALDMHKNFLSACNIRRECRGSIYSS